MLRPPRSSRPRSCIAVIAVMAAVALAGPSPAQEARPPEPAPGAAPESGPPAATETGSGGAARAEGTPQEQVPAEPGGEEKQEEEREEPRGTLRLITDAACRLEVGGRQEGELKPGAPRRIRVAPGQVKVRAISVEFPRAEWETTVEVTESEPVRVRIRMGRSIAEAQRKERQTEIFRDPRTGLMWRRQDNGADVTWQGAAAFCEELRHGGFDNWRLPTIDELDTLKAIWSLQAFKTIGGVVLSSCCAWSSTAAASGQAWNYDFRHRRGFTGNVAFRLGMRALCVRSLDPTELAELSKKAIKAKRKARRERQKQRRQEEADQGGPDPGATEDPPAAPPPR